MTGILLHLVYWTIFGHICPAQIDSTQRKQMLVLLVNFYSQLEAGYRVTTLANLFRRINRSGADWWRLSS